MIPSNPKKLSYFINPNLVPERILETGVLNKGMVTSVHADNIPPEALVVAQNARVRLDRTIRRYGKVVFGQTKPNSSPVRKLFQYNPDKYNGYVIRIADSSIYYAVNEGTWNVITGTLSSSRAISMTVVDGNIILANGNNKLQKIDISVASMADLSTTAPASCYVTGFAERVVAACRGNDPTSLATIDWSGNRNYTEFDSTVDESAGSQPLISSPSDAVDPITGIFGTTSIMIIPRQKSLWLATKQPIASEPFNFYPAVPNVGYDVPNAIQLGDAGLYGLSLENEFAYLYVPGQDAPEAISLNVKRDLFRNLSDPSFIFSAYDKLNSEYFFGIPEGGGDYTLWCYNRITQAWSFDEFNASDYEVSCANVITLLSSYTRFSDLTGHFDQLTGTFEELSNTPIPTPSLLMGLEAGEILKEDDTKDVDTIGATEYPYETILTFKEFTIAKFNELFNRIRVDYEASIAGSLILEYSKNSGVSWIIGKTITTTAEATPDFIKFIKSLNYRKLMWRIRCSDGLLDFLRYEAYVNSTGESQR